MVLSSSWRSPSNIALIKYWGKHGVQLPRNPSLSLTLSACHTDMKVEVTLDATNPGIKVLYDGGERPDFEPKIKFFFERLGDHLPWLHRASIVTDSINTFPHSAGIASSASSMSALALCLCDIDDEINDRSAIDDGRWWTRASEIARLASGSACRSVYPVAALWGKQEGVSGSSDLHAIPWADRVAPLFHTYQDTILIVSSTEKSVSSSSGHEFMTEHPYAAKRYSVATKNLLDLIESMRMDRGLDPFISICEAEALQLHALMMLGKDPFMLLKPNTISIINEIWKFRKDTGIPVCFTLDAGPNVHMLYPASHKSAVHDMMKSNLISYCVDGLYILDEVGKGPKKLS